MNPRVRSVVKEKSALLILMFIGIAINMLFDQKPNWGIVFPLGICLLFVIDYNVFVSRILNELDEKKITLSLEGTIKTVSRKVKSAVLVLALLIMVLVYFIIVTKYR